MVGKNKFTVCDIKRETEDVVTIFLSGKKFAFKAGQYVTVYMSDKAESHGKFYTISSAPREEPISFSVKKIGPFSSALHDLKVGDPIYISGPLGWFCPKEEADNLVFLAAGIGITPFWSIIKDYRDRDIKKQIDIFYSNETAEDICFCDELNKIAGQNGSLKIHYRLTSENGRIDAKYIKSKLGDLAGKSFFVCGPVSFVVDFRRQLLKEGVQEENIFTESFF